MQRILFRLGLEQIDVVENGQEAVDREATQTYDVILMDMEMPVMDGLEATRQILARPRVESTDVTPKIFFVTAHALDSFQARAEAAAVTGSFPNLSIYRRLKVYSIRRRMLAPVCIKRKEGC
jgi:CheY-like chemotaxis protein